MESLDTSPLPPSSHVTARASDAFFACHQLSATTATASLNLITLRTPGMAAVLVSSTDLSVPLNTGHWISAACSMPGSRTSMP